MKRSTGRTTGKPSAPPRGTVTLAIDVGGSGLKAALLDENGVMLGDRVRVPTPEGVSPEGMVDALVALVAPLTDDPCAQGGPSSKNDARLAQSAMDSQAENAMVSSLLSGAYHTAPKNVPPVATMLAAPLYRGAEVTVH